MDKVRDLPATSQVAGQSGFEAVVERNVGVRMRDGVVLNCDVWRPSAPGRYPVLLQRLPYDKSAVLVSTYFAGLEPLRAVGEGYVVIVQDARGTYTSGGSFKAFENESRDGYDTVEWAGGLPYSNGRVGMYGLSYDGATQLLAAMEGPAPLHAVAPHETSAEYYNGWTYQGGAFRLGLALYWSLLSFAQPALLRREASGEDVTGLREELFELLEDPWPAFWRLPLTDVPVVTDLVPSYRDWLEHPDRDSFWRATAVSDHYSELSVSALHIGGWYDVFLGGTLQNYTGLREAAASERARSGQRLIIGPWAHGNPNEVVGEVDFGPYASKASLDLTDVHLRWFGDQLLDSGQGTPDAPPVRLFVMGLNRWRDEQQWPLARARSVDYFLRSHGHANSLEGDGVLSLQPPAAEEVADSFLYNPRDPVPTVGGATLLPGIFVGQNSGPRDQRTVEQRRDVLVYTSPPLEQDTEVTGPVQVDLHAASSAPDTDWTAKLVDVHPDGRALLVTDGILRSRYRNGFERAEFIEPGRPYRFEIDLVATSIVFKRGHRIRVEVSSSNFPRFDRNPNTRGTIAHVSEAELTSAMQTVFHDAARPSRITLPVVP